MSSAPNFDWLDSTDIVCRRQPQVAVYENSNCTITIRAECEWDEDADTIITVSVDCLPGFITRLQQFLPATPKQITTPRRRTLRRPALSNRRNLPCRVDGRVATIACPAR